jgi:hypothetical protein
MQIDDNQFRSAGYRRFPDLGDASVQHPEPIGRIDQQTLNRKQQVERPAARPVDLQIREGTDLAVLDLANSIGDIAIVPGKGYEDATLPTDGNTCGLIAHDRRDKFEFANVEPWRSPISCPPE